MEDEVSGLTSSEEPAGDERASEDPAAALLRARRRKRRAWVLGLVGVALVGATWAAIANWPPPTSRLRVEMDVTCPVVLSGRISGERSGSTYLPGFVASPLPNAPGQTFVFEVDSDPGARVEVRADMPKQRRKEASRCQRAACRIYADGALVFEGLSTAATSLSCTTTADRRAARPAVSRAFADTFLIPVPAR